MTDSPDPEGDMMTAMVRQQMVNMVHPIAEQLKELQNTVHSLSYSLANVDARSGDSASKVHFLEEELSSVRVSAAKTTAALDMTQMGVANGDDERAKLISEHQKTRNTAVEVKDFQAHVDENLKILAEKVASLEGQQRAMALGLWNADNGIKTLNTNFTGLKEAQVEVKDRIADSMKEFNAFIRSREEIQREMETLVRNVEQNKEDRAKLVDRLEGHIAAAEKQGALRDHQLEMFGDKAKHMSAEISRLQETLERQDGSKTSVEQVRAMMRDLLDRATAHQKHFDRMEDILEKLGVTVGEEKQKTSKAFSDIRTKLDNSWADFKALDKIVKGTRDELPRQMNTVQEHQLLLRKVLDQGSVLQEELRRVAAWQKAAGSAVEAHSLQLNQLRDGGDSGDRRLSQVDEAVRRLQIDVGRIGDVVGSLTKRFDKSVSQLGSGGMGLKAKPGSNASTMTPGMGDMPASPRFLNTGSSTARPTSPGTPLSAGLLEGSLPGLKAGRPLRAHRADIGASSSAWMA